ncbi:MAG TPA: hypothetical protein VG406_08930 [Isosphaeraceae bacterium]|jgi:hypothetical protein|nr:hypothetical protein [Isosphaeraceae bacterium]
MNRPLMRKAMILTGLLTIGVGFGPAIPAQAPRGAVRIARPGAFAFASPARNAPLSVATEPGARAVERPRSVAPGRIPARDWSTGRTVPMAKPWMRPLQP